MRALRALRSSAVGRARDPADTAMSRQAKSHKTQRCDAARSAGRGTRTDTATSRQARSHIRHAIV